MTTTPGSTAPPVTSVRHQTLQILFPVDADDRTASSPTAAEEEDYVTKDAAPTTTIQEVVGGDEELGETERDFYDDDDSSQATMTATNICAICLEALGSEAEAGGVTKSQDTTTSPNTSTIQGVHCHHTFHRSCLMPWMIQHDHGDACPTCRQPLWDAATYRLVASTLGGGCGSDIMSDEAHDENEIIEEERSQQFRFRLAYFILAAVVLQISVFSIFIYVGNYNYPVAEVEEDAAPNNRTTSSTAVVCDNDAESTALSHSMNATLQAQCQYARTCRIPPGVATTLTQCQCVCWSYGSVATLYDATGWCVCEKE